MTDPAEIVRYCRMQAFALKSAPVGTVPVPIEGYPPLHGMTPEAIEELADMIEAEARK